MKSEADKRIQHRDVISACKKVTNGLFGLGNADEEREITHLMGRITDDYLQAKSRELLDSVFSPFPIHPYFPPLPSAPVV